MDINIDDLKKRMYTIKDVAEINNQPMIDVYNNCINGKYPGAFNSGKNKRNINGIWFIPKKVIDC